jgi:inorganic pyrophosphatase
MRLELLEGYNSFLFQAHPWHGVSIGEKAPETVTAFIEIVPTDTVKYELDKASGHLKIDRPQRFSSMCPTLYGFIPQTYCGPKIGAHCGERVNRSNIDGDGDPLDICVLTERTISQGNILLKARPIGGLRMIDHSQADDKIIAVLESDLVYGQINDIADCPEGLVNRLKHYFLSYKQIPNEGPTQVEITDIYGQQEALKIIAISSADYDDKYGAQISRLKDALEARK